MWNSVEKGEWRSVSFIPSLFPRPNKEGDCLHSVQERGKGSCNLGTGHIGREGRCHKNVVGIESYLLCAPETTPPPQKKRMSAGRRWMLWGQRCELGKGTEVLLVSDGRMGDGRVGACIWRVGKGFTHPYWTKVSYGKTRNVA